MGETRRKKKICSPEIVSTFSYKSKEGKEGNDFYSWVNNEWISKIKIPTFENDYGISEEVEHCISKITKGILKDESSKPGLFKDLHDSYTSPGSLEFLKSILLEVQINTKEDIVVQLANLCKRGFPSIFSLNQYVNPEKIVCLSLIGNMPGLPISYYSNSEVMRQYKKVEDKLGKLFGIDLEKSFQLEKHLIFINDSLSEYKKYKILGYKLERKFPRFPWNVWFSTLGVKGWRKRVIYYDSPRWIRFMGKAIVQVPFHYWKSYISRIYIINTLRLLPSPYDDIYFEFFDKFLNGQKIKMPRDELYINIVYDCLQEEFSKLFWDKVGDPEIRNSVEKFTKSLVQAAKRNIEKADWLLYKTRLTAMYKIDSMILNTVRPAEWTPVPDVILDPKNLLYNIFILNERRLHVLYSHLEKPYKYWCEGIFRVNAFYYIETNELIIPYATCIPPFYNKNSSAAWNYGSLGSIIGHEMCHGFDEDGKEYNDKGEDNRWWTKKDNLAYYKKTLDLEKLYHKQKVCDIHVNGKKTLSENIADLGGVGIALQGLKDHLQENGIVDVKEVEAQYREFFIAYATSWRTKYRKEKLCTSLFTDVHSPAFLRVNMVVSQFDEWYSAFGIDKNDEMFVKPADRIKIF